MSTTGLLRYQMMEPLGTGAQATTFRGIDRTTGQSVAIKAFALRGSSSWRGFERFERECELLRQLRHPGIPRFLDHFAHEETGDYFLVMELVEGQTLLHKIHAGESFSYPQILRFLRQGLSILGYLHAQTPPVVHRDINPANLLIDTSGSLKLVDFGAALRAAQDDTHSTVTMMGTPGYMAPEQGQGLGGPSSDLYALGLCAICALMSQEGEHLPRHGLEIEIGACVPPGALAGFLRRCVAANPQNRFPSAAAAYDALPEMPTESSSMTNESGLSESSQLANHPHLPSDLQVLARVQNTPLRVLFWLLAHITVIGLRIVEAFDSRASRSTRASQSNDASQPDFYAQIRNTRTIAETFAKRVDPFDESST